MTALPAWDHDRTAIASTATSAPKIVGSFLKTRPATMPSTAERSDLDECRALNRHRLAVPERRVRARRVSRRGRRALPLRPARQRELEQGDLADVPTIAFALQDVPGKD
jgi:hypothetical protein